MNDHPFWKTRRLMLLRVSSEMILRILRGELQLDKSDLPYDTQIMNVSFATDYAPDVLAIVVGSDSFPVVKLGSRPPEIMAKWVQK